MSERRVDFFNIVILILTTLDRILLGWLWEGLIVIAAPGAGKSSCVGKNLAMGMLKVLELGGLVLIAKSEETQNWRRYAKDSGREQDFIFFNAESGLCFDPLHYEWTRKGRGAGDMESILELFSTLGSISKPDAGHGHDPFWERGNEQLMRNVIKLLDLAGERISIVNIDRVIKSMPSRVGEHEEESWQKESYCAQLVGQVRARQDTLSPEQWSDLEFATQYIFKKWPAFDERPRSSLEMTWSGMADRFLFSPYNRLFCSGKCSFSPEDTIFNGKIIICDFPMLEYGHETGRFINVLLKLVFQRAWLRRDLSESPNPILLWQDEFQYFVTKRDNFFQETCRGSRVAVVALTQNILAISESLGETQPGSKTKSLLGNFATKVFMQQNETESCTYASEQLGKTYRYIQSFNASSGDQGSGHTSVGGSLQLAYILDPIEFTRLAKPDATNPLAESILYQSGRSFNQTKTERNPKGHNFLRVSFSRESGENHAS
jgi:hypothetical protein